MLSVTSEQLQAGSAPLPCLAPLHPAGGFSLAFRLRLAEETPGHVLLDATDAVQPPTRGWRVTTQGDGRVQLEMIDGASRATWISDKGLLNDQGEHHVVITVDGGPKLITILIDGVLCDGRTERDYGWGRFEAPLSDLNGTSTLKLAPPPAGTLSDVRLYQPCLRNSEAIECFHRKQ